MPQFRYKGRNHEGVLKEGTREANDKFSLYRDLRSEGIAATGVEEVTGSSQSYVRAFLSRFNTVPLHDRITFARNLGSMLDAGLALSRALTVMERQIKNPRLNKIVTEVNTSVKEGKTLSDSLAIHPNVFNKLFVSMVRAGEESGTLSKSLKNLSDQMNSVYLLGKKVKGALVYPAVIMVLMLGIGILMLVYVVPTLTSTFKELNIELPWSTRLVIGLSDALRNHSLLFLLGGVGLGVGAYFAARAKATRRAFDFIVLRIPIIGVLVKETNAARTARTLSALLAAGVEVVLSMEITENVVQNSYFKTVLGEAKEKIKKGDPIAAVFEANDKYYPPLVGEMISIGEETGKIGEMLEGVASFYENEVDQKTKDLSSVVEPFLMIFIGAAVGFFALAMITPTYSLVNAI